MLTRPGVLLTLALIVITIAAERSLVTAGTLSGGALLPAWEGSSSLWSQFLQAYHPAGIGSASAGPPYVGMLALLATVLLGKSWLAVNVLLLGCVPLAGISAFLALGRVAPSVAVRVWAAASYALLPVAFGAISAGRLGSAVAFALIPVIGMLAGRMFSQPRKLARRAAWATGLTVTVGTAFVPLLWPIAAAGAVVALLAFRGSVRALLANLAIVVLTPPVLLLPWLIQYLEHPSLLLLEAGLARPGLAAATLPARSLLLLSPGGPGLPPFWASAALVLAGLAALLASGRRKLVAAGWTVALLGFAAALLASRTTVTQPGGQQVVAWPGIALAVAAAGLLLAAAAGADGLGRALSSGGRSGVRRVASARGFPAAILALVACTAPVLGAAYWLMNGTSGPIGPATGQIVPSLVSTAGSGRQLRTLVLTTGAGGKVSYLLLRGASPQFSYPDVTPVPAAQAALTKAVASLVAPGGGEAANQSQELARFDIGFVLVRAPIPGGLAGVLNSVSGLTEVSLTSSFDLWRLTTLPSRVSVIEPSGAVVQVGSGAIGVSGAPAPAAGGTVLLAEPAGGWSASVSGHALTPVASPAGSWAQAFRLPAGGGTLTISRNALWHDLVMALELLAFLFVAALALPGIRSTAEMEAAAAAAVAAGSAGPDADAGNDEAAASRPDHAGPDGDEDDETAGSPGREPAVAGAAAAASGRSGRQRRPPAGPARRLGRASATRSRRAGAADDSEAPAATPGRGRSGRGGRDISVPAQPGAPRSGRRAAAGTSTAGAAAGGGSGGAAAGPGGIGAGTAGAAAAGGTLAGASRAAAGAGAGRGRRGREAIPAEAGRPAPRGAAWPSGQPVSRFVSGPPEAQPSQRGVAPADPWSAERDAGTGIPARDGQPAPGRGGQADPGQPGYFDAPGYAGGTAGYSGPDDEYPAGRPARSRGQRDLPGYPDRGGYPSAGYDSAGYDRAGYGAGRELGLGSEHSGQGGGRDADSRRPDAGYRDSGFGDASYGEAGYRDAGYPDTGYPDTGYPDTGEPNRGYRDSDFRDSGSPGTGYPESGYQHSGDQGPPGYADRSGPARSGSFQPEDLAGPRGGQNDAATTWRPDERASGWPASGQQQGWPQDHQQPGGWPQDDQQPGGWPQDYSPGAVPDDPGWRAPGRPDAWPLPEESLDALPPAGEVHHEWPGDDRGARGWPAPGPDDEEGEDW